MVFAVLSMARHRGVSWGWGDGAPGRAPSSSCPRLSASARAALGVRVLDRWPHEGGHEGHGLTGVTGLDLEGDAGCLALGNLDRGVAVAGMRG
jgi:hypothetical protein